MEDRILELLKEIPEKEIPEEFERTLSFNLKKEAWAMKRHRRTKALAVVAAGFLVVFGSISVYNDLGGLKMGGGSYDGASLEMSLDDDVAYFAKGKAVDGGEAEDMADGRAGDENGAAEDRASKVNGAAELRELDEDRGNGYGAAETEYLALLDEYLGRKDYSIKEVREEENGDWVFYVLYKGKERVFIGRSGEIHEQEGEKQQTDSD